MLNHLNLFGIRSGQRWYSDKMFFESLVKNVFGGFQTISESFWFKKSVRRKAVSEPFVSRTDMLGPAQLYIKNPLKLTEMRQKPIFDHYFFLTGCHLRWMAHVCAITKMEYCADILVASLKNTWLNFGIECQRLDIVCIRISLLCWQYFHIQMPNRVCHFGNEALLHQFIHVRTVGRHYYYHWWF